MEAACSANSRVKPRVGLITLLTYSYRGNNSALSDHSACVNLRSSSYEFIHILHEPCLRATCSLLRAKVSHCLRKQFFLFYSHHFVWYYGISKQCLSNSSVYKSIVYAISSYSSWSIKTGHCIIGLNFVNC